MAASGRYRLFSLTLTQDGVVLCADTRATGGHIIGDKNCEKLHYLAPNIYVAGAGTAADCNHVTGRSPNFDHQRC